MKFAEASETAVKPEGPARLAIRFIDAADALNRTDRPIPITVMVENIGGETIKNLTFVPIHLPSRVELFSDAACQNRSETAALGDLGSGEKTDAVLYFKASAPVDVMAEYRIEGEGIEPVAGSFRLAVTPSLGLPKADYVPEPRPVKPIDPDIEMGAFYFPGWKNRAAWERIRPVAPIRKPVLGWYDEGNPEVIDWQIKWALENGIQFFLVDWYWNKGSKHLPHWVNGFYQTRYHSMFHWAVMWANHNEKGSHSEEDQANVTRFWIDHYFKTPEYYKIDGKPVVMIWSPENMDADIMAVEKEKGNLLAKGEGVKRLLDLSRQTAIEAGLPGIYFIAMKWPENSTRAEDIQWLADAGFDMTSIYHFMDPEKNGHGDRNFPFDLIVDASLPRWRARAKTGIVPFLPNLSTGWDDRPWNNSLVISDRTPDKFRKICEDMKLFAAETGIKRFVAAPINEWGEGSYIEPNREFGFGMYEAIRETFCEKPADGWPLNYAPADVGLGPYDYPLP